MRPVCWVVGLFGLASQVGDDATVDVEDVAIHKVGRGAGEEEGGSHEVLGECPSGLLASWT